MLYEYEGYRFKMENFLVGPQPWNGSVPKESVNKRLYDDYNRQKHFLDILLVNLSSYMKLYVWGYPKASKEEMHRNAKKVIDAMTGNTRNWVPSQDSHESRTFSFFIPTNGGQAQRISFDLKGYTKF